jgi:L-threonylcarbamoyladenylate synthase
MKTRILKVSHNIIAMDKIDDIVEVLRKDGIIVYPTETFYGLGVNGFSAKAIQAAYRLKKREASKPLSVMISDISMLDQIATQVPPLFRPLISEFWPGPLTIILKASPSVPAELQGKGTIGVRLSSHKWVRALVSRARFPITATSANITGGEEISGPRKVKALFDGVVDLIVDGGRTQGFLPSTVVDLSRERPRLIREGAISSSQLKIFLPSLFDPSS